jgi:hypothetical protein
VLLAPIYAARAEILLAPGFSAELALLSVTRYEDAPFTMYASECKTLSLNAGVNVTPAKKCAVLAALVHPS